MTTNKTEPSKNGRYKNPENVAITFFTFLTVLFIGFIFIASFTFGGVKAFSLSSGIKKLSSFPYIPKILTFHTMRDITTNVLLYMPLGGLIGLTLASRKKIKLLSPWLFLGSILSLSVESIQAFIHRFPDPIDILTNSIGYIAGFIIIEKAINVYGLEPAALLGLNNEKRLSSRLKSIYSIRFIFICIFLIVQLLPFDISVSLSRLYGKLFAGNDSSAPRIILDPFFHFRNWSAVNIHYFLLSWLSFIPLGVLSAQINRITNRSSLIDPLYHCILLSGVSEIAKIFILSARSDIIQIPLAFLGGLASILIVSIWSKIDKPQNLSQSTGVFRSIHLKMTWMGYCVFLCLYSLSPYRFELNSKAVFFKIINKINLIPFKFHFSDRGMQSAVDLIREPGLMLPLGVLTAINIEHFFPNIGRSKNILSSAIICAVFAIFLEFSQIIVQDRYVDVTDVLLAFIGGAGGAIIFKLFSLHDQKAK